MAAHRQKLLSSGRLAWGDAGKNRAAIYDGCTATGEEVDVVIDTGSELVPIEVKAGAQPRLTDAAQWRAFRKAHDRKKRAALPIHTGITREWLVPDLPVASRESVL